MFVLHSEKRSDLWGAGPGIALHGGAIVRIHISANGAVASSEALFKIVRIQLNFDLCVKT